jgi:hypothetical protein
MNGECSTSRSQESDKTEIPFLKEGSFAGFYLNCGLMLKLEGSSYEGRFVIADIRVDLPLPTERLAFFDRTWNPGNTVLMHREPHGIWRVDYQLCLTRKREAFLCRCGEWLAVALRFVPTVGTLTC